MCGNDRQTYEQQCSMPGARDSLVYPGLRYALP
ncbi:hypothetical protein ACO0LM_02100 [Undibacterium sp. Di26W]